MRRPTKMKVVLNDNADNNPDFYRLSLIAPLPKKSSAIPGINPAIRTDREYYDLLSSAQQQHQSDATSALITRRENSETERTKNMLLSQQEYKSKQQRSSVAQQNRAALLEDNGTSPVTSSPQPRNNGNIGNHSDSNSSPLDLSQLENLKKKREELINQLHQLDVQAMASFPSAIDTFAGSTIPVGGNAQAPSSHIVAPAATSLPFQQLTNFGSIPVAAPMGMLQRPYPIATTGIDMTGLSYLNTIPGNVGLNGDVNVLNQQLLMQQRLMNGNNSMGLGTSLLDINNTSASLGGSRVNQLELLAQRQSQLQLQLQQQHQQQNQQQQFGMFGNDVPRGPPYI